MIKKFLMFAFAFILILPSVIILSACGGNNPPEDKVVGFSIVVGSDNFEEDGGIVETTYGLWDSFDEFTTSIGATKHYESGGNNQINQDELTITCLGDGYETMQANEDGYEVTVSYQKYSITFTLIVNRAVIDLSLAQLDWTLFDYDGEIKAPKLINVYAEDIFNQDEISDFVIYSGEYEATEIGNYTLTVTIHDSNYKIKTADTPEGAYLDSWTESFEWEIR